ncbi:hypothetical protein GE061_014780 [Apolygus lucorum]|uniref:C2H2-type domain-containing protein n=1 Tax=Apolygus lucorum TaxID=248454 RepID=A0A8S9XJ87_APOLU|nr:hypothetical protein GE061_014780 [Apolygus lucorum]
MCSGYEHPIHNLLATEADEKKAAILDLKMKKKRSLKLGSKKSSNIRSAKERSKSTNASTPRRVRKKCSNIGQVVQRIDDVETFDGMKAFNDTDLPTVLLDYSTQYETKEANAEQTNERFRKKKRVHCQWHSPERNTSDSDMLGSESSRFCSATKTSSPVIILPRDPTPPGLYGYTPLGFNGYLCYTFKCVYCSKLFEYAAGLREHCDVHHYGDKPYECPFCGERFAYSMDYAHHLNGHITTKSFPTFGCDLCSIGFSSEWELKLHFATHTYSVPY